MINRGIVPSDLSDCTGSAAPEVSGHSFSHALEFVHFGLTTKHQLTTALARLRERGDREAVGEGFAHFARRKQPLTPGFAVPSPLGEGRYQLRPRCESKCRNSRARPKPCPDTEDGRIYDALYAFALLAMLLLVPIVARADGGVVRVRQASGPFLISVFTASDPLRAGPIDVSVLVQDVGSGDPVLDATVGLALQPHDSASAPLLARATHERATNKLLQAAIVTIPAAGRWALRVDVRRGQDEATVTTGLQVAPPAPRLAAIWPYLLVPPLAIAVFALHQALREDALHRSHSGTARRQSAGEASL
jgi:hypothetical protein